MKVTLRYENSIPFIIEDNRKIYNFKIEKEQKLLSIYMNNMYGEEAISMHEIEHTKSSFFKKNKKGFTIYDHDTKLGELFVSKYGYEMKLFDVYYCFYGGYHLANKHILCFDKERVVCDYSYAEESVARFSNTNLNMIFSMLLYMFNTYLPFNNFNEEAYRFSYKGVYDERYEFEK